MRGYVLRDPAKEIPNGGLLLGESPYAPRRHREVVETQVQLSKESIKDARPDGAARPADPDEVLPRKETVSTDAVREIVNLVPPVVVSRGPKKDDIRTRTQ